MNKWFEIYIILDYMCLGIVFDEGFDYYWLEEFKWEVNYFNF